MLKGHVFSEQIFGNQIFALFINTFLHGRNGVSNNYKEGMAITYSGSNIHIASGAICIQGRFLEEDSGKDIVADTDSQYCSLVLEINLDAVNTSDSFLQADYKIIKNASNYPVLTQNNIVKNNAGTYQYELARFRTSASGITDFQDRRTFLDFDTIWDFIEQKWNVKLSELEEELAAVEDGSAYFLNSRLKIFHNQADDSQGKEGDIGLVYFD